MKTGALSILKCRVTDFSNVDDVGFRIPFRRGGGRRAAKYDGPARPVSPVNHIANAFPLDVHTRGKHCIRPAHIVLGGGLSVLVDEPGLPLFRHQCGNEKEPLWRHERLDIAHQWESVVERSK